MRLIDGMPFCGAGRALRNLGKLTVSALAVTCAAPAGAATVDVFLISGNTAPSPGATAPLSITTTRAYETTLSGSRKVESAKLMDNFTFNVATALTANSAESRSSADSTDMGEAGAGTTALLDSEVAGWDNVNILGGGPDAPGDQIDFGRNSFVTFNPVAGGITELIVAELGGFNPFELWVCADADCSDTTTSEKVFGGISSSFATVLDSIPDFSISDTADERALDLAWLFRFSAPVTGYIKVVENDSRGGPDPLYDNKRLQVDFIGAGSTASSPPSLVPVPTGLPLLASGLGLFGLMWRRRKA